MRKYYRVITQFKCRYPQCMVIIMANFKPDFYRTPLEYIKHCHLQLTFCRLPFFGGRHRMGKDCGKSGFFLCLYLFNNFKSPKETSPLENMSLNTVLRAQSNLLGQSSNFLEKLTLTPLLLSPLPHPVQCSYAPLEVEEIWQKNRLRKSANNEA